MVKLRINGEEREADAPPEMPLLWLLRDLLNMTGTKFGCGKGQCGACTVHLDGQPVRSCLVTVAMAADSEITTIEGLAAELSQPLQTAWQTLQVPQCGYCQTGQIMSAAALLNNNPDPTAEQIDAAMTGNICRCGTYPRIRKAIRLAADSRRGAT